MRFLLDSNVLIDAIGATKPMLRIRMGDCDEDDMVTSAIVYAEVAHGSAYGKPPPLHILNAFLANIPVLAFDRAAGTAYAAMPFVRGRYDRLIAAHALSLDLTLITNNERDFADVPGLHVENWAR